MRKKLRTWYNRYTQKLTRSITRPGDEWVPVSSTRIVPESDGRQHFQFDLGKNVTVDVIEQKPEELKNASNSKPVKICR